ncbi:LuxR C-terminal-related transcriptional regulator [Serratia fonticola]|uniref:LuxR C-terminal-related transcriptional regulator n=1 Tax=Serratia fonticola TaxID=47917 RepID=UPI00217ACFDB|nr:LuxR C-terminal-related transcriptional regulator [Serratia fonticola]CAI1835843.1 Spore germination protein gerE [Serratia fonticola]CAI2005161.1 Spore germination protein gerE [Serratia fonticola]CAI2008774.1 Spore germination protein gerE [Serratia fonticola]CAI2017063.1 Spore germination protein gerE [Serratia fonticola]
MKPCIVIAILDRNHYFSQGIKHLLRDYLQAKGYTWRFVSVTSEIAIDLMVCVKPFGWSTRLNSLRENPGDRRLGTIVIWDTILENIRHQHGPEVLSRKARPDAVLHMVEEMFEQASQSSLEANKERTYSCLKLTPREREVLQGISWELTPNKIANKLSLSVKTVSTHKLTAMRKLGFRRNSELYHWLRNGGLEFNPRTLF